ncbi:hypothetical protein IWQ60_001785 [Tieghemiomyces parasiticus]|uniref:proline--tRNA ligase n=1 Tax=Tieghemiomyces parasiticus TaxID=78921 RepID=A0A9W8AJ81_9FUNG|nr:hypothetical protein IWQ60_001785 [Tieghemiomyces parasiticus]
MATPLTVKTLVLKPKTAKSAAVTPVMIVALDETSTNLTALAKHLNLKEMRFANEDLLQSFFQVNKDEVSPFVLGNTPKDQLANVILVLDAAVAKLSTSETPLSFNAPGFTAPVLSTAPALLEFFRNLPLAYKEVDFSTMAPAAAPGPAKASAAPAAKKAAAAAPKPKPEAVVGSAQLGVEVSKDADFSKWYQQVLVRSEMLDYYDVSGCYIIRPWAYFVWKMVQRFFGDGIEQMGIDDTYFPMFVSSKVLDREKDHIEGFAPEVAWVTKAGSSDLEEPIAVRPTSETVMYPYFAKWIRSHRDLPLRINQWCNVVRWEFKHPMPFIRTREFLWQEGHTAHLTHEGAAEEVLEILDLYRRVYEELLAVPVVPGMKSEKEKFAGGQYTTTVEGFIPATGRGIQGGTSHHLGQNFSKMFNVVVEDPAAGNEDRGTEGGEAQKLHVWQNSWGLSTRVIGVMVMVHGDDKGLVMPPRVAQIQAVVIPCGLTVKSTAADRAAVEEGVKKVVATLTRAGVRAKADLRENYTPGYKFNHWELRGVPLRLEVGPNDLKNASTMSVRRDTGAKRSIAVADLPTELPSLLETIQADMLQRAKAARQASTKTVTQWEDFVPALNRKCVVLIPWCERTACEDDIKDRSARTTTDTDEPEDEKAPSMGAKSLCIPFDQPTEPKLVPGETKCVACGELAKRYALFGRSY